MPIQSGCSINVTYLLVPVAVVALRVLRAQAGATCMRGRTHAFLHPSPVTDATLARPRGSGGIDRTWHSFPPSCSGICSPGMGCWAVTNLGGEAGVPEPPTSTWCCSGLTLPETLPNSFPGDVVTKSCAEGSAYNKGNIAMVSSELAPGRGEVP